ncbi:hypothetical protein SteCoe_37130 [Stentor coeruleus]|uniref:TNFR-Cys domain-containing protein n=1 Tax=Stentor coeruleus TaxID=5963 RepID=A0A1R2ANS1_9CILI|nr:hypothetical protein SteCoe_37130 [Stentor coeruleus]
MIISLAFIVFTYVVYSLNIGCHDDLCSICHFDYYIYNSKSCLTICPTMYELRNNTCYAQSSTNLLSMPFYYFTSFEKKTYKGFSHPSNESFSHPSQESPFPTKERGFYFNSTSRLVSDIEYVLAPEISLAFFIKPEDFGTVLEVSNNETTHFKVEVVTNGIQAVLSLVNSSMPEIIKESSITCGFVFKSWGAFSFKSSQLSNNITLIAGCNKKVTILNMEFRQDFNLSMFIGASNGNSSFKGFLYHLKLENSYQNDYDISAYPDSCDSGYFVDNECYKCDSNCQSWPWCIRNDSCSICYSSNCSYCSGYLFTECTECTNGTIPGNPPGCTLGLNCLEGSGTFACSLCNASYTLIDGLCLITPYNYNLTDPSFLIKFDDFQEIYGGIFIAGSNMTTYGPFNNPEGDDPIPAKNRGLYFTGSSYLQANQEIMLNYQFTLSIWVLNTNKGRLWYRSRFEIWSNSIFNIGITNYESTTLYSPTLYKETLNSWVLQTFNVDFFNGTLSVVYYLNQEKIEALSHEGAAFYDINSVTYIGRDNYGNYLTGFVYAIGLWQRIIFPTDFYQNYLCGPGKYHNCLWSCGFYNYYDTYNKRYTYCNSSCTDGCSQWGTCKKCIYPECDTCNDFYADCTIINSNPCLDGFYLTDYHTCCNPICKNCFGPWFQCLSCVQNYYLLGFHCVETCPEGFTIIDNYCSPKANPFLSLNLNILSNNITETVSNYVFTLGKYEIISSTYDINNPIPMPQRGLYFTKNSYLAGPKFNISHNFTFVLWIKVRLIFH